MSHRDVMDELAPSAHPVYNAAPTQATWAHNLLETNERIKKTLHLDACQKRFDPLRGPPRSLTGHKVSYLSAAASAAATRLPMPKTF